MKKIFFLIFLLSFVFFPKFIYAETNCVELHGTNRIKCFNNEVDFRKHLESVAAQNDYPDQSSLIRAIIQEQNGHLIYYKYTKSVKTVDGERVEYIPKDLSSIRGATDPNPGNQNTFCVGRSGAAMSCFNSKTDCQNASNKITDSQVISDCDGDGKLYTLNGTRVNSDGKVISDTEVVIDGGKVNVVDEKKYCFTKEDGTEFCENKVGCEAERKKIIDELVRQDGGENPDVASLVGNCEEKAAPSGSTTEDSNVDPGSKGNPNATDPGSAGNTTNKTAVKLSNPLGDITNLNQLITRVVNIALRLALIIASLAILWAGFQFVMAQGKEDKVKEAKKRLQWTVIGLAVILGANVIVRIVDATIRSLGAGIK